MATQNYYQILGVNPSSSPEEIRRAYRILARRYHPDVNPGHASEERFKQIAQAYQVLSDPSQRRKFDGELGAAAAYEQARRRTAAYQHQQARTRTRPSASERFYQAQYEHFGKGQPEAENKTEPRRELKQKESAKFAAELMAGTREVWRLLRGAWRTSKTKPVRPGLKKVSIVEVSVSMREAILGARKVVEIAEPEGARKVSVRIPSGCRPGSVLRLRRPGDLEEELVFILRVASHPFLSVLPRGLVVEIPISPSEAINGATVTVPTLDNQISLAIPPGSQSGNEIRLKERGIGLPDGTRGDLFYRLIVCVPTCHQAVGISQVASKLDYYYEAPVRSSLPSTLLEGLA